MEITDAVTALSALAQESRLNVFRMLVAAGEEGVAVGDIGKKLKIPGATLTFHLKELSHAGLIESQREGRSIRYSLCVSGMRELLLFLTKDCCQGRPELCDVSGSSSCCDPKPAKKKKRTGGKTK